MSNSKSLDSPENLNLEFYKSFIRNCLISQWQPKKIGEIRTAVSWDNFDWKACFDLIVSTGTAPLVSKVIAGKGILSQDMETSLDTVRQQVRVSNIILYTETKECLQAFKQAGIPAVLLKGLALVILIYHDYSLRRCIDADILVHKTDLPRAIDLLVGMGFKVATPEVKRESEIDYENEFQLIKQDATRTKIELHWSLFDSPYYQEHLPIYWFWQTQKSIDFYGIETNILGPEAQVIHLCGHLVLHHRGDELLWLNDIAWVIVQCQDIMDWEMLLEKVQSYQLLIPVQKVIAELNNNWSVPIPAEFLKRLFALRASKDEVVRITRLVTMDRGAGKRFVDDLSGIGGWRKRLRFILLKLFPSIDYMRQRYHVSNSLLLPLYYLYRWLLGLRSLF